jgi:hypothetical protein
MRQRKRNQSGTLMETGPSSSSESQPGRLGRDVQAKIGGQLRALYDEVVKEGVPDRFADLLKRLDDEDGKGSPA